MNEQLLLENIRGVLIRLEETIIFGLIERAQFRRNERIYRADSFGAATGGLCLMDYLLRETEAVHARMRRYTSPDELPFFSDLPEPILPGLRFDESPLAPVAVNANPRIREVYVEHIVPRVCRSGDDNQYGSSSVCDVAVLQALSHRVHYGMFVAESKYRANREAYDRAAQAGEAQTLRTMITNETVERQLLARVQEKARHYGQDVTGANTTPRVEPRVVHDLYRDWIIPLTKDVEVDYLLQRCTRADRSGA